ncbi:39S ribosomal protein L28, mitochondrial-like [Eriocheir sinensis]|uniref:39S ribosomal protein L28, mitochondrial-like n=1 Tax=Eriocheir sinensis TaxID=95602 RepID=UPI0021CA7390|nr:39S ribosomal protein L28, mitochondrial-like [Eriocheir sinensis]
MAKRIPIQLAREMVQRPWNALRPFQQEGPLARVPEHYKKFFWEWKQCPKAPVHYIPTPGKFEKLPNGDIVPVQNLPLPLLYPKEMHEGIWGGEGIIKGFQKRKPTTRRVPHYWVPFVKSSVVYSEILDRHMTINVTDRTLRLIDQHYGFDNYILETPPADLMSELALKLRREMLLALVRETLHPDNPAKRKELLEKHKKHILPEEEAEWYGLNLKEASTKQKRIEEAANRPQPLKHIFRAEFVEYLKASEEAKAAAAAAADEESSSASSWLTKVNPFAKKKDE